MHEVTYGGVKSSLIPTGATHDLFLRCQVMCVNARSKVDEGMEVCDAISFQFLFQLFHRNMCRIGLLADQDLEWLALGRSSFLTFS